jgi:hypothetical protein
MLLKKCAKIDRNSLGFFPIIYLGAFFKGDINEFVISINSAFCDTDTQKLTGISDPKTFVVLFETYIQF